MEELPGVSGSLELGLDSESVAHKIKDVYENVLSVKSTKS